MKLIGTFLMKLWSAQAFSSYFHKMAVGGHFSFPIFSKISVDGCVFPAVFLGNIAFDVVGLGVGPPCLLVDSEETLLTWTDERAPLARAAQGVSTVDSSETRTPVRELMWPSVLGESSFGCLQELINGVEGLEYAIQATASVWMPFEQTYNVESGDMDMDACFVPTSDSTQTRPKNDSEYGK